MTEARAIEIEYAAQLAAITKLDKLLTSKKLGKSKDVAWEEMDCIVAQLQTIGNRANHTDAMLDKIDYVYECLIRELKLNRFPAVQNGVSVTVPANNNPQGPVGATGARGPKGDTGGGEDFQSANMVVTGSVDSFAVTSADGARWDYVIDGATGRRVGSVLAVWTDDGSAIRAIDQSTPDVLGTTTGIIEFSVVHSTGVISLVANITSGTWTVRGTRYWIPNGGNFVGPVENSLEEGHIYVGNSIDIAEPQIPGGDVSMDNDGNFTIGQVITDAKVTADASIRLSKLEAKQANKAAMFNSNGILEESPVTSTELGYVAGATSNLQAQINALGSGWGLVTVPGTSYTILASNKAKVHLFTASGARTITLPAANTVTPGVPFWIKDGAYSAAVNNITINRSGTDLFEDGTTFLTLASNGIGVPIFSDGVSKWFVL